MRHSCSLTGQGWCDPRAAKAVVRGQEHGGPATHAGAVSDAAVGRHCQSGAAGCSKATPQCHGTNTPSVSRPSTLAAMVSPTGMPSSPIGPSRSAASEALGTACERRRRQLAAGGDEARMRLVCALVALSYTHICRKSHEFIRRQSSKSLRAEFGSRAALRPACSS